MPVSKELAKDIIKKLKPLCDEAEVFINSSKQLKIDILNKKIESLDNITDTGLAIRVIKDKKMGFAFTADFSEEAIEETIDQVTTNSINMPADELNSFPEPMNQTVSLSLVQKDIQETKLEDKIKFALNMEEAAYAHDKRVKKGEKITYQDTLSTTIIANTKGIDIFYEKAVCGAFIEVIAEQNKLMETGSWFKYATKYSDLDAQAIGKEAAKRAVDMLGAGQEKSGRAPVILAPFAGSTLLSAISPALSSESVQKGKSLFVSSIDKPVGSKKLNIIDSGILANGISSVPYDDEGVPTRETLILKDGVLKSYLFNYYSAKKAKSLSTANSFRGSFKAQPEIMPTNLYIQSGHKGQDEILNGISKGFLVTNIMGAHTINPISGDFSIGFSGFLIENGKLSKPVRGMTIAGNILDVLNHVEEIGSDLMFFPHGGNIGSPSILISHLSVSGS